MLSNIAKLCLGLSGFALAPCAVFAHGVLVHVSEGRAVTVRAYYETGEPMAGAHVAVYAPDDPARPWSTGQTDGEGRFAFLPDGRPGRWAVQTRLAGHGAMSYFEWRPGDPSRALGASGATVGASVLQRAIVVACIVWGCVGTALYFRRKPGGGAA